MASVGAVISKVIKDGVTHNSAAATALYVDSIIAPILPDMRESEILSDPVGHALDETLGHGALGRRLYSFRLWRSDGTILYSKDKALTGQRFDANAKLKAAFAGTLVASFESGSESGTGRPLLEVYAPILQPWSGEVVAVSEFYEVADGLQETLFVARLWGWLAVAGATLGFFLMLSAIALRGSRTIVRQSAALERRVGELSTLLAQNKLLRARIQRASERIVALNESHLKRIGADLHDGPAQLVALAAMKLDDPLLVARDAPAEDRRHEIGWIRSTLAEALREIRSICGGLILPHIEKSGISELIRHAARAHEQRTGTTVELELADEEAATISGAGKICIYRFVQEGLANAHRHAGGAGQKVRSAIAAGRLTVEVSDTGSGFDPGRTRAGALGLAGLRQRINSLGGSFAVETSGRGTTLKVVLDLEEVLAA